MSGSISIQSCSSNIISKSHNLARKTRGKSFSIFCCSCCLRLAYQACLPQHRLEYPHKRNWILALYKVCNIAPCQISNTKTSHKNFLCCGGLLLFKHMGLLPKSAVQFSCVNESVIGLCHLNLCISSQQLFLDFSP